MTADPVPPSSPLARLRARVAAYAGTRGSPRRVIVRNGLWESSGFVIYAAVMFFLSPFIVHRLGDSLYGVWEMVISLTGFLGFADIGVRPAAVHYIARYEARKDYEALNRFVNSAFVTFAAAGVLWLGSALAKDVKQHEVAKTLTEALAVNGATTLLLKFAANTRAPDDEPYAWPSGHTSSAFTVAAVLNEYYGPLVGIPSLALAGLVGYQRIDSRVHDFSDVVFGGMLGYIIGTSIARDEKAQFPELFGMNVVPYYDPYTGASGLALTKRW